MKIRIYGGYLADTHLFNEWCDERAKTNALFHKCHEECSGFNELAIESYAKRKKFPWRKKISVDYLPHQENEFGDVDMSQQHTIFALRDYDYTGLLAKFSHWDLFRETDEDREYKTQIEELGIKLGPWTIVSYVGHHGVFYNFSPEIVTTILDRIKERHQRVEKAKAKKGKGGVKTMKTGETKNGVLVNPTPATV